MLWCSTLHYTACLRRLTMAIEIRLGGLWWLSEGRGLIMPSRSLRSSLCRRTSLRMRTIGHLVMKEQWRFTWVPIWRTVTITPYNQNTIKSLVFVHNALIILADWLGIWNTCEPRTTTLNWFPKTHKADFNLNRGRNTIIQFGYVLWAKRTNEHKTTPIRHFRIMNNEQQHHYCFISSIEKISFKWMNC